MNFETLYNILGTIYNFFATLIANLNLPFNNPLTEWSYINPFTGLTVSGGFGVGNTAPQFLVDIVDVILTVLNEPLNFILHPFGVTTHDPIWLVLLGLFPSVFCVYVVWNFIKQLTVD